MTDLPAITPLPTPPARGQDPAIFIQRADAILDAIANVFVGQLNAFGPQLLAAIQERVTNAAAASYDGAAAARDAALAARNAAQGYANSVDPANLVHRTGDETVAGTKNFTGTLQVGGNAVDPTANVKLTGDQNVDGAKTFAKKISASLGIRINNIDLTSLTAAGKTLIEAADLDAQKAILGIGVEDAGGVGALVVAASTALSLTDPIAFGTTVAGSTLTTSTNVNGRSLGGFTSASASPSPVVQPGSESSLGLSGTWRLQTTMRGGNSLRPVGLWKRIV